MIYFAKISLPPIRILAVYGQRPITELFFIKIGKSVNPHQRMKYLSWEYARPVTILATLPGYTVEEREMQKRFEHLKFCPTKSTEWYYPARELLEFVEEIKNNSTRCLDMV